MIRVYTEDNLEDFQSYIGHYTGLFIRSRLKKDKKYWVNFEHPNIKDQYWERWYTEPSPRKKWIFHTVNIRSVPKDILKIHEVNLILDI